MNEDVLKMSEEMTEVCALVGLTFNAGPNQVIEALLLALINLVSVHAVAKGVMQAKGDVEGSRPILKESMREGLGDCIKALWTVRKTVSNDQFFLGTEVIDEMSQLHKGLKELMH